MEAYEKAVTYLFDLGLKRRHIAIVFAILLVVAFLVGGYVFMIFWNVLLAPYSGLPAIGYWLSVGIVFLFKLLLL